MSNPTAAWDGVPVFGVWQNSDGSAQSGTIRMKLTQRVLRVDGRIIYPSGATVVATIGDTNVQDSTVRSVVRAAWRAVDAALPGFDPIAWDTWWDTKVVPAAIFTRFPAADDPDIVHPTDIEEGYKVQVSEALTSNAGREYYIQPLMAQLDTPIPGINLGLVVVPPTSPNVPAEVFAKGVAGGVAGLDLDGDVVNAAGEKIDGATVAGLVDASAAGKSLLTAADAPAQRVALGLGTAALRADTEFATEAQGLKADSAVQPSALGNSAAKNVGTTTGTVAAGDDSRFSNQRTPTDGSVTTPKLADGSVTDPKLGIGRVAMTTDERTKLGALPASVAPLAARPVVLVGDVPRTDPGTGAAVPAGVPVIWVGVASPAAKVAGDIVIDDAPLGVADVSGLADALAAKVATPAGTQRRVPGFEGDGSAVALLVANGSATAYSLAQRDGAGAIVTGAPTAATHAATKAYVDTASASTPAWAQRPVANLISTPIPTVANPDDWYPAGWGTGGAGTLTVVAGAGRGGEDAARATWTTAATGGGGGIATGRSGGGAGVGQRVTPGAVVTGAIYVQPSAALAVRAQVVFLDDAGATISGVKGDQAPLAAGETARVTVTATVPTGATRAVLQGRTDTAAALGTGTLTVSAPSLVEGAYALPHRTLAMPGALAQGVEGASPIIGSRETVRLAHWGDSITANVAGDSPVEVAASILECAFSRQGVIGESSTQIAERHAADTTTRDWTSIFGMGHNGASTWPAAMIIADIQACVDRLTGLRRFLVLELIPWADHDATKKAAYAVVNAAIRAAFPDNFVPVAQFLRTPKAASIAGVTFTAQDNTDISNSLTPTGLRLSGDPIHLNHAGRKAYGWRIAQEVTLRGWDK